MASSPLADNLTDPSARFPVRITDRGPDAARYATWSSAIQGSLSKRFHSFLTTHK